MRVSVQQFFDCALLTTGENGGRADVRWGSVHDRDGHGITAVADHNLLQMSVTQ